MTKSEWRREWSFERWTLRGAGGVLDARASAYRLLQCNRRGALTTLHQALRCFLRNHLNAHLYTRNATGTPAISSAMIINVAADRSVIMRIRQCQPIHNAARATTQVAPIIEIPIADVATMTFNVPETSGSSCWSCSAVMSHFLHLLLEVRSAFLAELLSILERLYNEIHNRAE